MHRRLSAGIQGTYCIGGIFDLAAGIFAGAGAFLKQNIFLLLFVLFQIIPENRKECFVISQRR